MSFLSSFSYNICVAVKYTWCSKHTRRYEQFEKNQTFELNLIHGDDSHDGSGKSNPVIARDKFSASISEDTAVITKEHSSPSPPSPTPRLNQPPQEQISLPTKLPVHETQPHPLLNVNQPVIEY